MIYFLLIIFFSPTGENIASHVGEAHTNAERHRIGAEFAKAALPGLPPDTRSAVLCVDLKGFAEQSTQPQAAHPGSTEI